MQKKRHEFDFYKGLALVFLVSFTLGSLSATAVSLKVFEATTPTVYYIEPSDNVTPSGEASALTYSRELDPQDVELIARTIWGEAGGVQSEAERAAVAWCVLNRVDAFGKSVEEVITAPQQFQGYLPDGDCPQEHLELAADVLTRWLAEKDGAENVGRVLPADYLFFIGDGARNYFSTEFGGSTYWDWALDNPYI